MFKHQLYLKGCHEGCHERSEVKLQRAGFKVAKWGVFCPWAWLQISPARFKQVYSDRTVRTHDRNLQTSKSLKLTLA